jgi:hypothetical protein
VVFPGLLISFSSSAFFKASLIMLCISTLSNLE